MKPPNTNFVTGCAVRVASMAAAAGSAAADPAKTANSVANRCRKARFSKWSVA